MELIDAIRWFGIAQGCVVLAILWTRPTTRTNVAMKVLVLLLTINIAVITALDAEIMRRLPWTTFVFIPLPYLYGPLVWWYVRSVVYRPPFPPARFPPHMIPYVLDFLAYAVLFIAVGADGVGRIAANVYGGSPPWPILVSESGKLVSGVSYTLAVGSIIVRNRDGFARWITAAQQRRWVVALLALFLVNWGVVAASVVAPGRRDLAANALLVTIVLLIYLIAFFTIRNPEILNPAEVRARARKQLNVTDDEVTETLNRVTALLESGAFADERMNLRELARKVRTHPNRLSFVVNDALGLTVPEFINGYRLRAFLDRVEKGELKGSTMLGIALDVGFRSKSTFHRVFSNTYGESPSQYIAHSRGGIEGP